MPERYVALHRSRSAKPPRRQAGLLRSPSECGSSTIAAKGGEGSPGMAAGRSPFSEVPPKTDCQPRHRPGRAACAARGCRLQRPVLMSPMHVDDLDNAILQGRPHFPHDLVEVRGVIKEHHVRFVHIDPRVSSVSGGLRLQNTHDARRAIDPLPPMNAWKPGADLRAPLDTSIPAQRLWMIPMIGFLPSLSSGQRFDAGEGQGKFEV